MQWQYFLHFFFDSPLSCFSLFPFFLLFPFAVERKQITGPQPCGIFLSASSHGIRLCNRGATSYKERELQMKKGFVVRMSFSILFCFHVFIRFMMDGIIARRVRMKIKTLSALWEEKEKMRHRNSHKSGDGPKVHSARRERPLAPSSHSPVGPFSRVEPFRLPLGGRRRSKGFLSRARTMQVDVGHGCRLILCWICLQCPQSCQAWF